MITILLWLPFFQTKAFSEALKDGGVILSEPKKVIPPETFYLGKYILECMCGSRKYLYPPQGGLVLGEARVSKANIFIGTILDQNWSEFPVGYGDRGSN